MFNRDHWGRNCPPLFEHSCEGFQAYLEAELDDGFVGRDDVVEPRRGNRRWPDDVKARIVAESLERGVRAVDVARRNGVVANQLSDWRRQVRDGFWCWRLRPQFTHLGRMARNGGMFFADGTCAWTVVRFSWRSRRPLGGNPPFTFSALLGRTQRSSRRHDGGKTQGAPRRRGWAKHWRGPTAAKKLQDVWSGPIPGSRYRDRHNGRRHGHSATLRRKYRLP